MNAITVGLVLEHRMVVDILTSWLNRHAPADIHLVATAATSTAVRGNLADATVIIADRHSLTALASTESGTNAAMIVLLTNHPAEGEIDDERVRAYIAPTDEVDVLTDAIRSAAEPTASAPLYRSPRIADFIAAEHRQATETENAVVLTVKQRRVLDLYVDGLTAQEIAETLGMARNTVRTYIKNIRAKYRSAGTPVRSKIELLHAAHSPTTITKPPTRKAKTDAAADTEKSKPRDTPDAEPALPRLTNINGSEEEPSSPTLTVADLSRIFSLDEKTVRKHLKAGTIPAYRVRHHWLIFTAEVRALFDAPQPAPDILADYGDTMKPRDLQTLFGSSRQTISLWLKQGILPGYWTGTRWLIHTHQIRQTLTAYSNRNTHVSEPGGALLPPTFVRLSSQRLE